jgi:hypothetical protein
MLIVTLAAIVVIVLVYVAVCHKFRDPYGTYHVRLNILPGEVDARTEWLNMGYWKVVKSFLIDNSKIDFFPEHNGVSSGM